VLLDPASAGYPGSPGEYSWDGAASTFFLIDPAEALIVVLCSQFIPWNAYPLRREMRVLTYQALVD
jgi:CubicO group peptidase (beta-lactamase class C family)